MSKRESIRQIYLAVCMIMLASKSNANPSALNLDVYHEYSPGTQPGALVINCSLNARLANMDTLASLTVFGSKPFGRQDELVQLAVVDMWTQGPKLSHELKDAEVVGKGEIGRADFEKPYLILSWNSPTSGYRQFYKCVANGIDSEGQPVSSFTTVKVEVLGLSEGCCKTVDSIESDLRLLSGKVENTSLVTGEILQHVQALPDKIEVLDTKLEQFQSSVNFQLKRLAIDRVEFIVSGLFRDRVYAVSRQERPFNIGQANEACQDFGGYLVELDDDEEYQFVYDFVARIGGGSNNFWTGGNDIDQEGTFVYYNSKKPVPDLSGWSQGQPNNYGGSEDCMEIRTSLHGLNDFGCFNKGKIVCEVSS